MTQAMDSQDARAKFRHLLDDACAGAGVERDGKPTAAGANHTQWQAWKRQRSRAGQNASNYLTQEALDLELAQRGLA